MSCTFQWSLSGHQHVCISKRSSHRQLKKTSNRRRSQLTQYWSYKPRLNFKPTWKFFENFICVLQMILLTKMKKILMSVLGLNSKDRKSTRDKPNISYPKVNRDCALLTANRTSADCVQISLGPLIPYIPLGVYHTWGIQRYVTSHIFVYLIMLSHEHRGGSNNSLFIPKIKKNASSASLDLCEGNATVAIVFPSQRATKSFQREIIMSSFTAWLFIIRKCIWNQ